MQLISERGRATVNWYLGAPEALKQLCDDARKTAEAREQLITLVWLMAGAVVGLEHALAFDAISEPEDDTAEFEEDRHDWSDERLAELIAH